MKKVLVFVLFIVGAFIMVGCKTKEKTLTSLELENSPTKVLYVEGESFDKTGLKIMAVFDDNGKVVKEDVTNDVTFNKTTLKVADESVEATYKYLEVTKTVLIPITVKNKTNNGLVTDNDLIIKEKLESEITISANSTKGKATSYWFVEYHDDAVVFEIIVEDQSIDVATSVYNSDGIEILVYKTARGSELIDGTIAINVGADGKVETRKANNGDFEIDETLDITPIVKKVSFDGEYIGGYKVTVELPYTILNTTKENKDITFLPSLYNNQGVVATIGTTSKFNADANLTHTYIWISNDNTFEANPWMQLGVTFGDLENLKTSQAWDISNDDGTDNASIEMTKVISGTDNNAYMYKKTDASLYAYASFSAKEVHNGEKYGKFGLTVTSLDGKNGLFFFVDASGDGTNMSGTNVGIVKYNNGGWAWPETIVKSNLQASSYQNDNYVKLAVYRSGDVFAFYVNDERVAIQGGFSEITETSLAVVGIASFNITLKVKDYEITTDKSILNEHEFNPENVKYLFIGDSYVDKAFWTDFNVDFPTNAVNLGVGGTKVDYWNKQAYTLSKLYIPENIIIHIGVNNINDTGSSAEATLAELNQLFDLLLEFNNNVKIYFISIEPNNFRPDNFSKYQHVNDGVKERENKDQNIKYIDMVTPLGGKAGVDVAQYFSPDGLHYNKDGYGLWTKVIKNALGIERIDVRENLGDYDKYARSGGWKYEENYIINQGFNEQQIYFNGVSGTDFAVNVQINVQEVYNNDAYPKVGIALKSKSKTVFFYIDAINEFSNLWGNYVIRQTGGDWNWGGQGEFKNLGDVPYNGDSFKKLGVVRVKETLYFYADDTLIMQADNVFGNEEITQASVMLFNLKVRLKDAEVYLNEEFDLKIQELGIN